MSCLVCGMSCLVCGMHASKDEGYTGAVGGVVMA